ncbi:hypothetical protein ACFVTZ_00295 [Cellulosimicrobium cellulans]|uniref:hypothetical protein n=1 Tax=Cellulosimicrobium cellulans TaxID=1710 RepID=UPI0036E56168
MTSTSGSTTVAAGAGAPAVGGTDDVRDIVGVGVLMPNGRLAGRSFASRAEAEAWARPEEGEQVVELNVLCDCDL